MNPWRDRPRSTLRRNILLLFLVLSLAPLLVSNTVGYLVTRRIIRRQVTTQLTTLAETEARYVTRGIERHLDYLEALAREDHVVIQAVDRAGMAVRSGRGGEIVQSLNRELERSIRERHMGELLVLDTTGLVIAATNSMRVGSSWSDTEVFRRGINGRIITDFLDTSGGVTGLAYRMASPIHDHQGRRVGVLVGIAGVERAYALLDLPQDMARQLDRYILDGVGRIVYKSNPDAPLGYATSFQPPQLSRSDEVALEYVTRAGIDLIGLSVRIPGSTWHYVVEVPESWAFGDLQRLGVMALALEAVFALMLVGVVWRMARSIVSPLHRLVIAAERIRSGELGVQVKIQRSDELGDLGNTFNQMSSELQASAVKIEELHAREMTRAAQLASVGELASGIAHEVKTPLVGMASGIDLLLDRAADDPKAQRVLHQMRAETARLESAIRNLLRYARPPTPRYVTTSPQQLITKLIGLVQVQADAAGVRIEQQGDAFDTSIRVDPELFTQMLVNLTLNGIQAMQPGGVLTLAAKSRKDEVRLAVSDTGTGIAESAMDMIFRPFYTTKHRGTGLGLAISRGIVERHGGRIEVDTKLGYGATFTVVLPTAST